MRRGGTNPTAAAVGLLQLTAPHGNALMAEVRDGVVDFLAEMASPEGGLRANGRAPPGRSAVHVHGVMDTARAGGAGPH